MSSLKEFLVKGEVSEGDLLPLPWDEGMSVGDSRLDDDHRKLLAGVNNICAAVREGESEQRIRALMLELLAAELLHLRRETDILQRAGYPELARHEAEHQRTRTEMLALRAKADEIKGLELVRLSIAIKNAFLHHLLGSDLLYKDHLLKADHSTG